MAGLFGTLSPYTFAISNPTLYNDPLGDCPDCGSWEDRFDVRNGPNDSFNPNRIYRYGDPFGSRAKYIAAYTLELQTYGYSGPRIYNEWCDCLVSAEEVLAETNPNQNKEYRRRAQRALDNHKLDKRDANQSALATTAATALLAIKTDALTPDATDTYVPKWIAEAVVAAIAAGVIMYLDDDEIFPGPWNATTVHKADPKYNLSNDFDDDPLKGFDPKVGIGAAGLGTVLSLMADKSERQQYLKQMQEKVNHKSDATKYIIPLRPR